MAGCVAKFQSALDLVPFDASWDDRRVEFSPTIPRLDRKLRREPREHLLLMVRDRVWRPPRQLEPLPSDVVPSTRWRWPVTLRLSVEGRLLPLRLPLKLDVRDMDCELEREVREAVEMSDTDSSSSDDMSRASFCEKRRLPVYFDDDAVLVDMVSGLPCDDGWSVM